MKMNLKHPKIWFVQALLILLYAPAISQNTRTEVAGIPVNYDESRVGAYTLPDPLVMQNGDPVKDAASWYGKRRPEILDLFEREQFGRSPDRKHISFEVFEKGTPE